MIYSATCEYAVRALARLASEPAGAVVKLRRLAEQEDLPPAFLAKIFGTLVDAGLLRSAKGPTGGYALARRAEQVTLYDVRRVMDGVTDLTSCAVGLARCSDDMPCPLHDSWKPLRQRIERYLEETTLRDMAEALARKDESARRGRVRV